MEIYALVGRSGTGKSFKAQAVAGMHGIDYILDDGLLIKGTKVIAGISAKREKTKFAAVRRAVYLDEEHKNEIISALLEAAPEKILIVGTSQHMVNSIMGILNIDGKYIQINIEDISTTEELELAFKGRKINGKHIIPVPTFEIKKAFSGYFIDSIKQFTRRNEKSEEQYEKSVVRPTFSYLGSYEINDVVLKKIIEESALEIESVKKVVTIDIENKKEGIIIVITTVINYKKQIPEIINEMSKKIKINVEFMTGINVLEINTIVKSLVF
jgi:uncharacterized alkaline shock family protein YloU